MTSTRSPNGRRVVTGLIGGVGVLCAISWFAVSIVRDQVDTLAAEHDIPRLSAEEAAIRVAKEDRFGLPSRLENPPERDIEVFRKIGTPHQPLPSSEEGIQKLLETRHVSLELCRKATRPPLDAPQDPHEIRVTLTVQGDWSHPTGFEVIGHDVAPYEACVIGGLQDAFFEVSEATTSNFVLHSNLL